MKRLVPVLSLFVCTLVLAQSSPSFQMLEYAFNTGGYPDGGTILSSSSFQISMISVGQGLVDTTASSGSFSLGTGFVGAYPPPVEVTNLVLTDSDTFVWNVEPSLGNYNLYRGTITQPFDPQFGTCFQSGIASETADDIESPAIGVPFFYLVTALNRLGEEGTKGYTSAGLERDNSVPCP